MIDVTGTIIKVGNKVKWHDPGIMEYEIEDRKKALSRVFEVIKIDPELEWVYITDGVSYAEVYPNEVEIIKD